WRRVSHCSSDRHFSPDFTSNSSSSGSSSDSSSDTSLDSPSDSLLDSSSVHSSGCDASGQSYSGPLTRVASPRLVYPPIRTPRCSDAFMRWRSTSLSTLYPFMTSELSLDSSSEWSLDSSSPSVGPSRKRCRSLTTLVPSSTPASKEVHIEIGTADAEAIADLGIGDGVRAPAEDGIGMRVDVATSDIREDEEEFEAEASTRGTMEIVVDPIVTGGISKSTRGDIADLEGTLYDIDHYMSKVPLDRITELETAQRQLEAGQLVAGGERAGLADRARSLGRENLREEFCQIRRDRDDTRRRLRRTMTNTRSGMTRAAIEEMINRRMAEALEAREANRNIKLGNGNDEGGNGNGNGNGNGGGNGNGNHNENDREWFEKIETVFLISNCPEKYQVKYATCTLLNNALTWWNSHKRTIGTDAEFVMSWREIMKLMVEVYAQELKFKRWNLSCGI
ncbi:hypothetical protein Tco_1151391, partial [Tanacetum coccineum]